MDPNPIMPQRLPDLSDKMRLFLAAVRDDEIENLRFVVRMRDDERDRLEYVIQNFTKDDLETLSDNFENFRSMKRFGRFGLWLFGFIVAGASAAGVVRAFVLKDPTK